MPKNHVKMWWTWTIIDQWKPKRFESGSVNCWNLIGNSDDWMFNISVLRYLSWHLVFQCDDISLHFDTCLWLCSSFKIKVNFMFDKLWFICCSIRKALHRMYPLTLRLIYPMVYPKIRLKSIEPLIKAGYSTNYQNSMVNRSVHEPSKYFGTYRFPF